MTARVLTDEQIVTLDDVDELERAWELQSPRDPRAAGLEATVVVTRNAPDDIQDRWIRLWLDGEEWEILRYGQEVSCTVPPGRHAVKAHNTLRGATVEFDARPGEQIRLRCVNKLSKGGMLSILMIGVAMMRVILERE